MSEIPVFVGGFRSGSTMLVNLLGLHPDVAPWFETKCLVEALRWIRVLGDPGSAEFESTIINPSHVPGFDLEAVSRRMLWHARYTSDRIHGAVGSGKAPHESYPIGADCIDYSLDEFREAMSDWHACIVLRGVSTESVTACTGDLIRALADMHLRRRARRTWVNKTPEIPRFALELRSCLGECKFVHLIRDGREVAASGAGLNWGSAGQIARYWARMVKDSRRAAEGHERTYLEVRYERLVAEPRTELANVLRFLGLREDPALVERYEAKCGKRIGPDSRELKSDRPEGDKQRLLAEAEAAAADVLVELGYLPQR